MVNKSILLKLDRSVTKLGHTDAYQDMYRHVNIEFANPIFFTAVYVLFY